MGAANKPTLAYQSALGGLGVNHEEVRLMDLPSQIGVLLVLIALVLLAGKS